MALELPSVSLQTQREKFKSSHFSAKAVAYNESLLATKTLAALVQMADTWKMRHDGIIAQEALQKVQINNRKSITDFEVTNHNPTESDFDNSLKSLKEQNQKIYQKEIADLDWRVRTRFNEELNKQESNYQAQLASSMIRKRYEADLRVMAGEATMISESYALNYMDDKQSKIIYDNATYHANTMADFKDLHGADREAFIKEQLSTVELNAGLTAMKDQNFGYVRKLVKDGRGRMLFDHWRKLKAGLEAEDARQAARRASAKIDPAWNYVATVNQAKNEIMTADYIKDRLESGMTHEAIEREALSKAQSQVHTLMKEQEYQRSVDGQVIDMFVNNTWSKFKDDPRVKEVPTTEQKIEVALQLANGGDSISQDQMMLYNDLLNNKYFDSKLVPIITGNNNWADPDQQKLLLSRYDDEEARASLARITSEKAREEYLLEQGADNKTISVIKNQIRIDNLKAQDARQRAEGIRAINSALHVAGLRINPAKNDYTALIPRSEVGKNNIPKAQKIAQQYFYPALEAKLGEKHNVTDPRKLNAILSKPSNYMDNNGNLLPEVLEAIEETQNEIRLQLGIVKE